ncbi:hypothetical protein CEB3_c38160 [Peptococcaceae bacterium CEB3]|nr:hypothetical protein CEB3_c38160 [Peptococcaceae bacterium CEB3]
MDLTVVLRDFGVLISESLRSKNSSQGNIFSGSPEARLFPFFPAASYFRNRSFYCSSVSKSARDDFDYDVEVLPEQSASPEQSYRIACDWFYVPPKAKTVYASATGNYKNVKPGALFRDRQHILENFADSLPDDYIYKELLADIGRAFRETRVAFVQEINIPDNAIVTIEVNHEGVRDPVMGDPVCQRQLVKNVYGSDTKGNCPICGQRNVALVRGKSTAWKLFTITRKTNAHTFDRCECCENAIGNAEKFLETHTVATYAKTKAKNTCLFIPASAQETVHTDLWFHDVEKTKKLKDTLDELSTLAGETYLEAVYALHVVLAKSNAGINLWNTEVERIEGSVIRQTEQTIARVNELVPHPEISNPFFSYWEIPGLAPMVFRLIQGKTDFPLQRLSALLRKSENKGGVGSLVWLELFYLTVQKGEEFMTAFKNTKEYAFGELFRLALRVEYFGMNGNSRLKAKFANPRPHQIESIGREALAVIHRYENYLSNEERKELSEMIDKVVGEEAQNTDLMTENQRMIAFFAGTQKLRISETLRIEEKLRKAAQQTKQEGQQEPEVQDATK